MVAAIGFDPSRLQRGRVRLNAETWCGRHSKDFRGRASTGPRSPERGDRGFPKFGSFRAQASTGPRSPERGDPQERGGQEKASDGFNGAAFA